MITKNILILFTAIILSSCAHRATPEQANRWVGATSSEVIMQFGVPDMKIDLDGGGRALEYRKTAYSRFKMKHRICQLTFMVDPAGIVKNVRYAGDLCHVLLK